MSPGEFDRTRFLADLKACGAVAFGTFTLASGRTSSYYVDIKKAVTRPDLLRTIAEGMAPYAGSADRIAGVELGAVPIAAAVSLASGKPYLMVRKSTKEHGTKKEFTGQELDEFLKNNEKFLKRLKRLFGQIEKMREAARITAIGMKAALAACRVGVTENDVAAAAMDALVRAGSEYFPSDPIVTSGFRAGIPHTTFERRRLERGDTVLLEMTGAFGRYVGPLMRAVSLGEPTPKVRKMADLCVEGLNRAIAAIRPGVTAGQVDDACRTVMEEAGMYESFRKRTGYSVGLAFPPNWNEGHIISLGRDDPTVLEPGMVFHMPPALRDYGVSCVGFSETVAVTAEGCNVLTTSPRALTIA